MTEPVPIIPKEYMERFFNEGGLLYYSEQIKDLKETLEVHYQVRLSKTRPYSQVQLISFSVAWFARKRIATSTSTSTRLLPINSFWWITQQLTRVTLIFPLKNWHFWKYLHAKLEPKENDRHQRTSLQSNQGSLWRIWNGKAQGNRKLI